MRYILCGYKKTDHVVKKVACISRLGFEGIYQAAALNSVFSRA